MWLSLLALCERHLVQAIDFDEMDAMSRQVHDPRSEPYEPISRRPRWWGAIFRPIGPLWRISSSKIAFGR